MKLYKVTDHNHMTMLDTQWGPGVTHTAVGLGIELCSEDVIHAYEDPRVAVLMSALHVRFSILILWEAEGEVVVREGPLKCGVKSLTTLRIIDLPVLTDEQRVEIAIRCTLMLGQSDAYRAWAERWLNGTDRTRQSARETYLNGANGARYSAAAAACCLTTGNSTMVAHYAATAIEFTHEDYRGLDLIEIIKEVTG